MESSQTVEHLITRIGEELDLPGLGMNEQRMCVIDLGDHLSVTFACPRNGAALYMAAELVPVLPVNRLALYDRLLRMNFLLIDTGGASLAIDESSQNVFLCQVIPTMAFDESAALQVVSAYLTKCVELQAALMQRH